VEAAWVGGDERRKALPLVLAGNRVGTVLVDKEAQLAVLDAVQARVLPALAGAPMVAKNEETRTRCRRACCRRWRRSLVRPSGGRSLRGR